MASISGISVPPPPSDAQRQAELRDVHALTDHRTPSQDAKAIALDQRGAWALWQDQAAAYRKHVGFLAGWAGTLRMDAAIGAAGVADQVAKLEYRKQRPFQLDPTITPLGPIPKDTSYPSGHSAAAGAAATVLEDLWPQQRRHYEQLASDVRWARVYSGVHFPSDVRAGDQLGRAVGSEFTDDD